MKRFALLVAALAFAGAAAAQNYPARPLRIVIPWPPGQATDLMARIIAQKLSEDFGQQVVADNRPGAGGMIGTDVAAKATPDGYTLLAASSGPVSIRFASSGTGATAHLFAEIFNGRAGLQVIHVPYKGSAPALIDVMGGQVEYALETVAAGLPHVKVGRLRTYGITTSTPSKVAPGIEPLATAANLPGFDLAAWIGIMVPSGTPKPLVDRLSAGVDKAMQAPDTGEKLATSGLDLDYRKPDNFARYLKEQRDRFAEVIKKNNIRIE